MKTQPTTNTKKKSTVDIHSFRRAMRPGPRCYRRRAARTGGRALAVGLIIALTEETALRRRAGLGNACVTSSPVGRCCDPTFRGRLPPPPGRERDRSVCLTDNDGASPPHPVFRREICAGPML
ncbi:hypothetical protein CSOJ01_03058 [Colletotrichum sojae]|uniref:Uncharacterized protein n=1 Tax=Colletotrichum sojae TaxID=2175907 RepID=A0A8H6JN17_9PEZI|nr:hypothetical protein CSOJ01_03058 [Colletotrichum sojae]